MTAVKSPHSNVHFFYNNSRLTRYFCDLQRSKQQYSFELIQIAVSPRKRQYAAKEAKKRRSQFWKKQEGERQTKTETRTYFYIIFYSIFVTKANTHRIVFRKTIIKTISWNNPVVHESSVPAVLRGAHT